jgi:16S rRNA (cytidine1402-2'-O)-methyltransferase
MIGSPLGLRAPLVSTYDRRSMDPANGKKLPSLGFPNPSGAGGDSEGMSQEEGTLLGEGSGLKPGLALVATPIGNLQDLSPRARQALAQARKIYAEDTRTLHRLLSALGLSGAKRVERLDHHATPEALRRAGETIAEIYKQGELTVYCSDAGTPGVSDPGAALVAEVERQGVLTYPVPGPSAVAALVSVTGWLSSQWGFLGFLPRKDAELVTAFQQVLSLSQVVPESFWVWFEAPTRIVHTLEVWNTYHQAGAVGGAVQLVLAKELTKIHERIWRGSLLDAQHWIRSLSDTELKGEWILAIQWLSDFQSQKNQELTETKSLSAVELLTQLSEADVLPAAAAKLTSQLFGVSRNLAYQWLLQNKPRNRS